LSSDLEGAPFLPDVQKGNVLTHPPGRAETRPFARGKAAGDGNTAGVTGFTR